MILSNRGIVYVAEVPMIQHNYIFRCLKDKVYYAGIANLSSHFIEIGAKDKFVSDVRLSLSGQKLTLDSVLIQASKSFKYLHDMCSPSVWSYCLTYNIIASWLLGIHGVIQITHSSLITLPINQSNSHRLGYNAAMLNWLFISKM